MINLKRGIPRIATDRVPHRSSSWTGRGFENCGGGDVRW